MMFIEYILQQEKIKNVIRLPPEKIPTRYSSLLRLRLRQETNKIDSEIKQYLNSYTNKDTHDFLRRPNFVSYSLQKASQPYPKTVSLLY